MLGSIIKLMKNAHPFRKKKIYIYIFSLLVLLNINNNVFKLYCF